MDDAVMMPAPARSLLVIAVALAPTVATAQRLPTAEALPKTVASVSAPAARRVLGYGNAADRRAAAEQVSAERVRLPLALPIAANTGPEVLRVQILLDAARYGPGVLDARWSENTLFALRAFRDAEGLVESDELDDELVARLEAAAGGRDPLSTYTVTAADVRGPFRTIPKGTYAKARLDCLCYASAVELLGERFHTSAEVLARLNPGVDLRRLAAGAELTVPNVVRTALPAPVARLVVDRAEGGVHGFDAADRLVFWLPSTVGSRDEPSPKGRLRVVSVERNPAYHFNPRVLGDVPDSQDDAMLAPGPNSPVGVLWAQLSKDHVGIHGTADPELVGYAQSHGCVRVTNWDARWLTELLRPGMPVEFR